MSNASYLRKLSFHLTGISPEDHEYTNLAKAEVEGRVEQFFEQTIDSYLSSSRHIEKMDFRLSELFWLVPIPLPDFSQVEESKIEKKILYHYHNSLNSLFRDIIAFNKPWDYLLLSKEYEISGPGTINPLRDSTFYYSDFGYFGALQPDKIPPTATGLVRRNMYKKDYIPGRYPLEKMKITFKPDDLRVAGALTTGRFSHRYSTSIANADRRRAQAIYRIFLCDMMKTVQIDQERDEDFLFRMYFSDKKVEKSNPSDQKDLTHSLTDHQKMILADPHGKDKACLACHQKLDPVGKVYMTSSVILSPVPSPGALVMVNAKGDKEVIPVKGIGELAKVITKRKEYLACQVSYFWKWFIGEDVPLNSEGQDELMEKFEKVGRRPNDFIKYLVKRPEFKTVIKPDRMKVLALKAKKVLLHNCNNCHLLMNSKFLNYDSLFESGNTLDMKTILNQMYLYLDLEHDGKNAKMPPKWSKEKLSLEEIQDIKKWMAEGAPNSEGEVQVRQE